MDLIFISAVSSSAAFGAAFAAFFFAAALPGLVSFVFLPGSVAVARPPAAQLWQSPARS